MDIPEYYKIIAMAAKENYFNLPYIGLKMQKQSCIFVMMRKI